MSALPLKADMCGALANVCFGPKADISQPSLYDLICALLELQGHLQAECLRGFEVDNQLQCSRLDHGKIGWFGAAKFRYLGPTPLIEDNSVRSHGMKVVNATLGYRFDIVVGATPMEE